jgi:hypothetical protein
VEVDVSVETDVLVWTLPPASVDVRTIVLVLVDVTGSAVVDALDSVVVSFGPEVVLDGVEEVEGADVSEGEGEGAGVDVVGAGSALEGEGVGEGDEGEGDGDGDEVGVVTMGVEVAVVAFGVLEVAMGVDDVGVLAVSSSSPALTPVPCLFTIAWPLCGAWGTRTACAAEPA